MWAHPMLGRVAWAGSRTIRTLEPSVMVISRACQSISLTYWSKKFVPKIPGTTRLSTTTTSIRPLQPPISSDHTPWPQRRTLRPSPSRMEPSAAPKGSPPVDFRHVESDTTETTAPLSKRRDISCPFTLLRTDDECPAGSSVIARRRRSLVPLFRARAGRVRVRSWGQSRRMWPRPPHSKHSVALCVGCKRDGRSRVASSLSKRRAKASTALVRPPFPDASSSTVFRRPSSISVTISANCRACVRVVGCRRQSSRWSSLHVRPKMKRWTRSPSDFPALRPTSATSRAKSRIGWPFRCRRPPKRTCNWI
ncbi:hypothetical protein T11_15907 [Trichinella zimbabwensis]|uniref:Uncharacterized protein n=1 Tax=Trichinella zimbabwensis TaxID=268475 RepID=A0A0V1GT55_9BILA|nr:hypothetical protein T11_15907 [Trichinella zimbabwensis]